MSTAREEIFQMLDSLTEDDLEEVLGLVKVLVKEPDELTPDESKEVDKAEEEIGEGHWVKWEDVRRTDV